MRLSCGQSDADFVLAQRDAPRLSSPPFGVNHLSAGARDSQFILIVDDDDTVRASIRDALGSHGYAVLEARNGREALRVVFDEPSPDVRLIVSDLEMPEMSGEDLVKVLSSYAASSRIPVVVMSGAPRFPRFEPHANVVKFLTKPVAPESLLAIVRSRLPGTLD